jgi:hypothetical protein
MARDDRDASAACAAGREVPNANALARMKAQMIAKRLIWDQHPS